MTHPIIEVTVDGTPVAGAFYERLVTLEVTDKEGLSSDTFSATLNDGPPNYLALPRKGAIVDVRLGYRDVGMSLVGRFTVDQIDVECLPYSVKISGKAADLRRGKLKNRDERHWDNKTVGDIVRELAGEAGLIPAIDAEVGAHEYDWLAQEDEPTISFIERLAKRHDALFAVKGGRLIFAKRGSGNTAGGSFVGSVIVTPAMVLQGSCKFEANDRSSYQKVVAYYQDRNTAQRVEVEVEADADADSVFRLSEPYADVAEAEQAAEAQANDLKRSKGSASVAVAGDTSIIAGAPLLFRGVRPGLDGVPYVISTVRHEYSKKAGFLTKIDADLYDGSSSKAGGGSGSGGANANEGSQGSAGSGGETAANAVPGTPATPSHFLIPRTSGRTDEN